MILKVKTGIQTNKNFRFKNIYNTAILNQNYDCSYRNRRKTIHRQTGVMLSQSIDLMKLLINILLPLLVADDKGATKIGAPLVDGTKSRMQSHRTYTRWQNPCLQKWNQKNTTTELQVSVLHRLNSRSHRSARSLSLIFCLFPKILSQYLRERRAYFVEPDEETLGSLILFLVALVAFLPIYPVFGSFLYDGSRRDALRSDIDTSTILDTVDSYDEEETAISPDTSSEPQHDWTGRTTIETYTVQPGDTIAQLALDFHLTHNTIRWSK